MVFRLKEKCGNLVIGKFLGSGTFNNGEKAKNLGNERPKDREIKKKPKFSSAHP